MAYKRISWLAVILWMAAIFYLSHQPGSASSHLSSGIVTSLLHFLNQLAPGVELDSDVFHTFVRKNAHFFAYFLLCIFSLNAWKASGFSGSKRVMLGLGTSILFAITDEVHQLFIAGRSGEVRDVCIDSAGAGLGVVIYLVSGKLLGAFVEKARKKKKN